MSQKLILPIQKAKLTASYKSSAYTTKYGLTHYGCDIVSTVYDRNLRASGTGKVVAAGRDSVVGNVVAVLYPQALNRVTGQIKDVVLRYFHLASIGVKVGSSVTKDTLLGVYGNTGQLPMSPHLHLESDTDTARPLYSPTVLNSSLLRGRSKGATDATMQNPLMWLHCKRTAPDNQSWTTAGDSYIRTEDKVMPFAD